MSRILTGIVIQQLPSFGQLASESMSSQNKANSPPTHSPLHGFKGGGGWWGWGSECTGLGGCLANVVTPGVVGLGVVRTSGLV